MSVITYIVVDKPKPRGIITNMRNVFANFVGLMVVVALIVSVSYGGWKFSRYWNYKFGYQSLVQKEVKPLMVRIENLEKRVAELEKKK